MSAEITRLPCKVCGDASSGIHYGVLACHACKGFFGRHLRSKNRSKPCAKRKRCNIRGPNKTECAPCRFRACLRVGMSKEAIQTGRYSLQRKHDMLVEVTQFENRRKVSSTDGLGEILQLHQVVGPNGETVDDVIKKIVDAYDFLPSNLRISQEYLDTKLRSYWEMFKLKEGMFGRMPTVSAEEFQYIFNTTGIDIDDRFQFLDTYLNAVRIWLNRLVHFAKAIPGFKQLSTQDQFNLIRYNRFEFWFLGAYKGYNKTMETAIQPNGTIVHWEEFKKAYPGNAIEVLFDVSERLKRYELTLEEHIIVQTLSLVFPDRAPLENKKAVEVLQSMLVTCLQYLIQRRSTHKARVRALGHATDMLTTIRQLASIDECSENSTKLSCIEKLHELKLSFLSQEMALYVNVDSNSTGVNFDPIGIGSNGTTGYFYTIGDTFEDTNVNIKHGGVNYLNFKL